MKIGLSTSAIDRGRTGEGQYVLGLVRALLLESERHEFVLFVLEEDRPLFDFAESAMRMVVVDEAHRPPLKNFLWHQLTLPRLAAEYGLDVLHVPSHRRMLWPHPCPLVATIHDLGEFRRGGPRRWPDRRGLVRRLARRQDEIVAVSRATATDIAQLLDVPIPRVTVIHNGIDHQRFTPADREHAATLIARQYGVPPPFFLYVAPLEHPAKNHIRLISAFNVFKTITPAPWQLVLVGADAYGAETVHQAVRRSPYAQDIHCPGFAPAHELPNWYRAASVFVYPTLFEGFGLPPLEAMACGCPVLASAAGGVAEVCADAALYADAKDVVALQRELTRLAFEPELRGQLRAAGLRRAQAFEWSKTAAATVDVYTRAARPLHAPILAPPVLARPLP
jgi:glycosyltransferase involved in cell wall biosynthesis